MLFYFSYYKRPISFFCKIFTNSIFYNISFLTVQICPTFNSDKYIMYFTYKKRLLSVGANTMISTCSSLISRLSFWRTEQAARYWSSYLLYLHLQYTLYTAKIQLFYIMRHITLKKRSIIY